jgi:hypothetical protein
MFMRSRFIIRARACLGAASLLACVSLLAACSDDTTGDDDGTTETATYYQDVKPILDAKCAGCHVADGIAPFALTTYDEAKAHGPEAQLNVEAGLMPPWPPNAECNEYFADRSLTEEQKATIAAWVEGGMIEGDPGSEGEPLQVETLQLSRADLKLGLTEPFTTSATTDYPDEYRCFVLPLPASIDAPKYITGFRAVPGDARVVHHVIAFYAAPGELAAYQDLDANEAGPGYTCFGGSGGPSRVMLGGWAPGSLGSDFPPGTGLAVEPGGAVVMQVHYNIGAAGALPDASEVWFKVDDTVEKVAQIQPWANPQWLNGQMPIAAGDEDVMHAFEFDATVLTNGGDFTIYTAALHQHNLGTRSKASIERAGGGSECLLQIDDWDFHWQGSYAMRQTTTFHQGDKLRVECHWDNSPENQPMVGGELQPPQDVNWGEGTGDEMCVGFFYITPD